MRWIDGALMGFDTETTGVDVGTDRVVTAALVRRAGSAAPGSPSLSTVTWLIDPGVPIPAGAAAIHGVTTEHARAHGRPAAVALEEIATGLAAALRRGEPVVAFNASYDLSLLDAELRRHRLPTLPERIGRDVRTVVDPLVLDRHLDRYRPGKRRLGDLCTHYGVTTAALHSAEVDVLATLDVLAALAAAHPELAEMSLDEVHDLQVAAHRAWAEGFNAWRTQQGFVGAGAAPDWPSRVTAAGPLSPVPA